MGDEQDRPDVPVRAKRKATNQEIRQRLDFIIRLFAEGRTEKQVRSALRRMPRGPGLKPLSGRTVTLYIARAKKEMRDHLNREKWELVDEAYFGYLAIIQDAQTSTRDRLTAMKQKDDLLGLQGPREVALVTKDGEDVLQAAIARASVDQLRTLDAFGRLIEETEAEGHGRTNGQSSNGHDRTGRPPLGLARDSGGERGDGGGADSEGRSGAADADSEPALPRGEENVEPEDRKETDDDDPDDAS